MKRGKWEIHCCAMVLLLTGVAWGAGNADPVTGWECRFDDAKPGKLPQGWSAQQTKPSTALATWQVTEDATAPSRPNVLALTKTENTKHTFNLAIAGGHAFKDLDLAVKIKAVSGKEDQGGGPVWRYVDENNYYICRVNPLESNFRVYNVISGERKMLQSVDFKTETGTWYSIEVTMAGNKIACSINGQKLLEAEDDALPNPGKVGFWTKADAASCFDDLLVKTK